MSGSPLRLLCLVNEQIDLKFSNSYSSYVDELWTETERMRVPVL